MAYETSFFSPKPARYAWNWPNVFYQLKSTSGFFVHLFHSFFHQWIGPTPRTKMSINHPETIRLNSLLGVYLPDYLILRQWPSWWSICPRRVSPSLSTIVVHIFLYSSSFFISNKLFTRMHTMRDSPGLL